MSTLSQQLSQAASRNHELLDTLRQTNYAPPAFEQNNAYISDLQQQITKTEANLKRYHTVTEAERKDHLKYKDSVVKRYAYKLGGSKGKEKFETMSAKEEREFLEAWQREREAQDALENLRGAMANADTRKANLGKDKTRCEQAQQDLDQLYASIFSGPTPEVPGEDQVEQEVQHAKGWFDQCQMQSDRDKQAIDALKRAGPPMAYALRHMDDSRGSSQMDMMGGGALFDMMERDSLAKGQMQLSNALRHYEEAMRMQPAIPPLNEVNIDQGHLMSDVLFDNIFSDMAQHDRIKSAQAQMMHAADQLKAETAQQEQRARDALDQLKQAQAQLEDARRRLQRIRSEAFEHYSGGAPPAYGS